MITRIQALNFRSLRYIDQILSPFHVLVGPNASGKTTFLDVVSFLGNFVSDGLDFAIEQRTRNLQDLIWAGKYDNGDKKDRFELAIEASIPKEIRSKFSNIVYETIRYEVSIGFSDKTKENSVLSEKVLLKKQSSSEYFESPQQDLFPFPMKPPKTILTPTPVKLWERVIVKKPESGKVNFYSETEKQSSRGWMPSFKLGDKKSALGNLPEDEKKFPASIWLKNLLAESVQQIILNSLLIRQASPPGQKRKFMPDGSNLPWVIQNLKTKSPKRFEDWISHVRTALPNIQDITTDEFPDTKYRYLKIRYKEGFEVPSWTASDGTLRLLALTLPAYLIDFKGVYLIEEPENGIHPKAVDTMFQSLSSAYDAQILLATHSPVVLSIAEAKTLLCFAKASDGATDIVSGNKHPRLREWKGETNLGVLFASGVLG
jgi:predicted ATPase